MDGTLLLAILVTVVALAFDFSNGFHDASNIVATMISSRAMSPKRALFIAATFEFVGAIVLGTAVAHTVGKGLVDPAQFSGHDAVWIVLAALVAAIGWNLFTWWFGIPSSSSHALIGGLLGAFLMAKGPDVIRWGTVVKVFGVLVLSPVIGGIAGFLFTRLVYVFFRHAPPRANDLFRHLQTLSSMGLAISHGGNDAQKTMGVITMALVILGYQETFHVPFWVMLACAVTIALGISSGGWRIIKTLGGKLYRVRPLHGFSSQTTSALVLWGCAAAGFPVSTTQVIASSITGVGAAERLNMVRWGVVGSILVTWVTTIPGAAAAGAAAMFVLAAVAPVG